MNKTALSIPLRIFLFISGLYIMGLGVALSVAADLGTSPISSLPFVLSVVTPLSMGTITFIMNMVFVLLQILILKKDFKKWYVLQIPGLFLFSAFIDLNNYLLSGAFPDAYWQQFLIMLAGCVVLAFGIFLLIKADFVMMPGDFLVRIISKVAKKNFGHVKIGFDCIIVAAAAIVSFASLQCIVGIREGSLVAAVLVGFIVNFYGRLFTRPGLKHSRPRDPQ
ncbi:MAG TPA: DUF6198 family protein [Methanocorpusculum sp.]|nr:DUF6198 family protein [Methanocorpusculum sp.]